MAEPDEPPFNGNGTVGRLLTCEVPAPAEMLRRRRGICSERYEREKAEFDKLPWYERMLAGHGRAVGLEPTDALQSAKRFREECEKMPDEIPKSWIEDKQQQLADHVNGKNTLPPEQSLKLRRDSSFYQDVYQPGQRFEGNITPTEQAWLDNRNLTWGNTMAFAFMGPFAGPGMATRALGFPEAAVANVNEMTWGLASGLNTRVREEAATQRRNQSGKSISEAETNRGAAMAGRDGTVIQKPPHDYVGFRRDHILNRHRAGAGKTGKDGVAKTEFPANWSDQKIVDSINRVAGDQNIPQQLGKWNSPYKIGVIDGVRMRVDFYPLNHPLYSGQVSTGFPF
ncbi:EndoU domain-containing protein [Variovorax sp. W2I14]|uniref:EndoU domain-containing protein n=1 Tax=Variovorax sp. W2I14 TaxID=3042290 RepID=UPI003D209F9B